MTYNDIYSQALTYTGETADSTVVSDYNARADYLFPGVLARLSSAAKSLGTSLTLPSTAKIEKTDPFPLSDILAPVAAMYLASLLVAAEYPDLSTRLISIADATLSGVLPAGQ